MNGQPSHLNELENLFINNKLAECTQLGKALLEANAGLDLITKIKINVLIACSVEDPVTIEVSYCFSYPSPIISLLITC